MFQEYELEETKIFDVSIFQLKDKWKFSEDSIFLAKFAAEIENKIDSEDKKKLLEIGSGCGVITILLSRWIKGEKFLVSVEIDKKMALVSGLNYKNNNVKAHIICGDIKQIKFKQKFNIVLSNPPYLPKGEGKISKKSDIAKWEIHLDLKTLAKISSNILEKEGRVYVVYPSFRLGEVLSNFYKVGLKPVFLKFFHHSPLSKSDFFALMCQKDVKHKTEVLPPFFKIE